MSEQSFWIVGLIMLSVGLLVFNFYQYRQIECLKSRLRLARNEEALLSYLRTQLADKPKVAAIKALRTQYPELTLVEAVQLWERK